MCPTHVVNMWLTGGPSAHGSRDSSFILALDARIWAWPKTWHAESQTLDQLLNSGLCCSLRNGCLFCHISCLGQMTRLPWELGRFALPLESGKLSRRNTSCCDAVTRVEEPSRRVVASTVITDSPSSRSFSKIDLRNSHYKEFQIDSFYH